MSDNTSAVSSFTHGSLDWLGLAKMPATFTLDFLARLSQAGVDGHTYSMGPIICTNFRIGRQSQTTIHIELAKLRSFAVLGNIAHFGFGLQPIIRKLAMTEEGLAFVTLCGLLEANYDSFYAAEVFRGLCRTAAAPSQLTPSLHQWQSVVQACAGIFSGSKFPSLVEGFTRILSPPSSNGVPQLGATAAEAMTRALDLLGRISDGRLKSCTFSGGIDCAWLAAVSEFMFQFKVSIVTADGTCLYETSVGHRLEAEAPVQVTILKAQQEGNDITALQKVFVLPQGLDFFNNFRGQEVCQFQMRSQWSNILGDAFGDAATKLLQQSVGHNFAMLLCFVARRAESFVYDFDTTIQSELYGWPDVYYSPGRFSAAEFLEFAARQLPELKLCLRCLDVRNLPSTSEEQAVSYVREIERACGCPACTQRQVLGSFTCLKAVAGTIMRCLGVLSAAMVQDLLPSPYGFRKLYKSCVPSNHGSGSDKADWKYQWPAKIGNLVREAFMLFATEEGARVLDGDYKIHLAACGGGVCTFQEMLRDINCSPLQLGRVRVLPGCLSYEGSVFSKVDDLQLDEQTWTDFLPEAFDKYRAIAKETLNSRTLAVAFQAESSRTKSIRLFQPGRLVHWSNQVHYCARECPYPLSLYDYHVDEDNDEEHEEDVQEVYAESLWEIHVQLSSGSGWTSAEPQCDHSSGGASWSLILISSSPDDCTDLAIYKLSTEFWQRPDADYAALYAEFAYPYRLPMDRVLHHAMVPLNDCPRCILQYVSTIWPRDTGPYVALPDEQIEGRIVITVEADDSRTIPFQLKRLPSATTRRTCPVSRLSISKLAP